MINVVERGEPPWTPAMISRVQGMLDVDDIRREVAVLHLAAMTVARDPTVDQRGRAEARVRAAAFAEVLGIFDGKT